MWFMFPKGTTNITVERQEFVVEAEDAVGNAYFRAPDHFSPRILMVPGFRSVEQAPEGAPPDLPKMDPVRDDAISQLSQTNDAFKLQLQNLQADLAAASAANLALTNANKELSAKLAKAAEEIEYLREELEEKPAPAAAVVGKSK